MALPTPTDINELFFTEDQFNVWKDLTEQGIAAANANAVANQAVAASTERLAAAEEAENVISAQALDLQRAALESANIITDAGFTIAPASLVQGIQDKDYSQQLTVVPDTEGAEITITDSIVSGLPTGLAFNEATLSIIGIPTQSGFFQVKIQLFSSGSRASKNYALEIGEINCA